MKRVLCLGSLVFLTTIAASTASAQSRHAQPSQREGFLVGFSAGFGAAYPCDVCPSFAGSFQLGAMATPSVAVLFDGSAVGGDDERQGGLGIGAIAVQFWPHERFWLRLGVGVGGSLEDDWDEWEDDWDNDRDTSDRSWAGIAAAGFEIVQKGRFAMDMQVRGGFVEDRQSVALSIGFNWY